MYNLKKYKSFIQNNPEHVYLKKPNVSGEFLHIFNEKICKNEKKF